jgi:hypothetical protein
MSIDVGYFAGHREPPSPFDEVLRRRPELATQPRPSDADDALKKFTVTAITEEDTAPQISVERVERAEGGTVWNVVVGQANDHLVRPGRPIRSFDRLTAAEPVLRRDSARIRRDPAQCLILREPPIARRRD